LHASNGFANSAAGSAARAAHRIVGIDIATGKNHAFFGTAKGQPRRRRLIFTNDLIAVNSPTAELFKFLGRYDIGFGDKFFAAIIGLKGLG
jgi:hypothetical protein